MESFPFTEDEWSEVETAALAVTNATLADDPVLRESTLVELIEVLNGLRCKYGDHAVLAETEADFCT